MSFWVAKNRQKPPENNAFAERARRKRRQPEAPAPAPQKAPEPAEVADAMPDLQALREAAQRAAELVHAEEVKVQEPTPVPAAEAEPAPEAPRRGRLPDPAVQERHAKVLNLVTLAGPEGTTKPALAEALEEKEQQVYTSLRALQKDGKVESKYLDGLGYRWVSVSDQA